MNGTDETEYAQSNAKPGSGDAQCGKRGRQRQRRLLTSYELIDQAVITFTIPTDPGAIVSKEIEVFLAAATPNLFRRIAAIIANGIARSDVANPFDGLRIELFPRKKVGNSNSKNTISGPFDGQPRLDTQNQPRQKNRERDYTQN